MRHCFLELVVAVSGVLAVGSLQAADGPTAPPPAATDGHFVRQHWAEFGIEHGNPISNRRFRVNAPEVVLHPEFGSRSETKSSGMLQILMPEDPRLLAGAELYLELWGGHPGTANRRVAINGRSTYAIEDQGGLSHCTYQYPRLELKRTDVVNGYNALQFACDQGQTFWGHMIVDNACLQAILAEDHPDLKQLGLIGFAAAVKASADGERLRLSLDLPQTRLADVASVEFHGFYEGYDENGNTLARDWHGFTKGRQPQAIVGVASQPPFEVNWDTTMLVDQAEVAIRAVVRMKQAPNLYYQTPPLVGIKLPRVAGAHVAMYPARDLPAPFWSRASRKKTCTIRLETDPATMERAELHVVVWDGGAGNVRDYFTLNGHPIAVAGTGKHDLIYTVSAIDPQKLKRGDNEIVLLSDTEHHGIEVALPGPALVVRTKAAVANAAAQPKAAVNVSETTLFGDMDCLRIETPAATYVYGKRGAGFASIIDKDGHDWISYRPLDKALGEYRGLPKCGQPTKFFHCGYGYGQYKNDNPFISRVTLEEPGHIRVESETIDRKTAGTWDFYPTHATFTLLRIDLPTFWFLYEGTPGGKLESGLDFVVRPGGEKTTLDQPWSQVVPWACFGASESPIGLLLINHQAAEPGQTDSYVSWPFEKDPSGSFHDMTVFGFGRKGYKELIKHVPDLTRLPARFSIALVEQADHATAQAAYRQIVPAAALRDFEQHALIHDGDAARGRELFLNEKLTKCAVCHKVNGQGGDVGPDLSSIGGKFGRPHLIESLLEPSRQILEGYRSTVIRTGDGRVLTGIVKEQSASGIVLLDAGNNRISLSTADIDERKESSVSLMPDGLANLLTPEQFTDLVAYLETLRPGGKPTPGAGITGAIKLPSGFEIRTIATGLTGATAMQVAPDGRILLCEQTGSVRVVKQDKLLPEPFLRLPVDTYWERGVIGVTFDPDFPGVPYVYVCYVAKEPYPHHHVSRFVVEGDVAAPASEQLLLVGDDQRTLGGKIPAGHQGGALHFGHDGKLYVAIGEQTAGLPAQKLDTFQGKILRINSDGTIPEDNPFFTQAAGKYRAIWCLGLRNPFTFAVRPTSGELFINDVGGEFEEINRGQAGANYGWPAVEHGPTKDPQFRGPEHYYPHASIAGGDFCPQSAVWPTEWRGRYFFADFVHGWIKTLDPDRPQQVESFASGLSRPCDLRFRPDGRLLVLLRNAWVIDDKFQPGTGALIEIQYTGKR
jgi:putative heme-binding domain-containing protein